MSRFPKAAQNLSDPAADAQAVTPNDSTDIDETRGLYVGVGGAVKVDMASGNTATFSGIIGGTVLPVRVTRVYNTDTDASSILALY